MNPIDLKNDIVVFDMDGVLVKFDFPNPDVIGPSEEHMKCFPADEWIHLNVRYDMYKFANRITLFDKLIAVKDPQTMYVLSTAMSSFEQNNKIDFIKRNYPKFLKSNILFVADDSYKVNILPELKTSIRQFKPGMRVVLIDDSFSIMLSVENSHDECMRCFHISDFI